MRIRLWNAFASNNSGSYTIVGHFDDSERAAAIAELLRPVLAEHSVWLEQEKRRGEAPLHRFIREQSLSLDAQAGLDDDWPTYGPPPEVVAIDQQVLVHCDYTITMPRFLGELFYARGGRVGVEINHGHHPTVVIFEFWYAWESMQREEARVMFAELLDALRAGPLASFADPNVAPAWATPDIGPMMQVAVVFEKLVEGVRAVQSLLATTPAHVRLRVFEAPCESGDPLAGFR